MIAGPGIYICNQCVAICGETLAKTPDTGTEGPFEERPQIRPWDDMSLEEMLAHLPQIAAVSAQVEGSLKAWVHQARGRGASWTRIGDALAMKRQSAWERFSDED
ncbi:MAG: hypothetical protein L0G99_04325 [Propionibacteriales bacterium]|nr:hypothetical protein [Propionibacteriales bacterium]